VGKNTGISWTDQTFNPWWGCTEVSPGCDHCYARDLDKRWGGEANAHWGKGAKRRTFSEAHWKEPLRWNANAVKRGEVDRVFCLSMGDVMDDEAPGGERDRLWQLIDQTPNLLWQLLTKRPTRYEFYLPVQGFKHDNVMLGCTVESQPYWNTRIPQLKSATMALWRRNRLRDIPDAPQLSVRPMPYSFASYEPALGPIRIEAPPIPDWVIFGGETGPVRRPTDVQWARDMREDCERFGIAFFMKQLGAQTPEKAAALIPIDLLLRQLPGGLL
jgi:protein gp37